MANLLQHQILRMPGEDSSELWMADGQNGWKLAPQERETSGGTMAVECLALDSAPFWSAATHEHNAGTDEMVALHWEAMGIDRGGGGRSWCHWRAGEVRERTLVATMALPDESQHDSWVTLWPERFEPSARLLPIPSGECAVWKELGRFVVAFTRRECLLHVAVLSARTLDREAAQEISELLLALEVRGFSEDLKGCRIWTKAEGEFIEALQKLLNAEVRVEAKPTPRLPKEPSGLLPNGVVRARHDKARKSQLVRLVATAALVCFSFFTAWTGWLWSREQRVEKTFARLSMEEPQVQAVRNAQLQWAALEIATNSDQYPVEAFHQLVSLLPSEGIQLQEFALDDDKLVVSGMATSVNHALKLKDAIEHCEPLQRYAWNFPQPSIKDDNRASFRAEGSLNGGTSHEGQ